MFSSILSILGMAGVIFLVILIGMYLKGKGEG
jgi:hypothetical protein